MGIPCGPERCDGPAPRAVAFLLSSNVEFMCDVLVWFASLYIVPVCSVSCKLRCNIPEAPLHWLWTPWTHLHAYLQVVKPCCMGSMQVLYSLLLDHWDNAEKISLDADHGDAGGWDELGRAVQDARVLQPCRWLLVEATVPHAWLLPRCSAMLHAASAGAVAAAALAGTPQLACPLHFDQYLWVSCCISRCCYDAFHSRQGHMIDFCLPTSHSSCHPLLLCLSASFSYQKTRVKDFISDQAALKSTVIP